MAEEEEGGEEEDEDSDPVHRGEIRKEGKEGGRKER